MRIKVSINDLLEKLDKMDTDGYDVADMEIESDGYNTTLNIRAENLSGECIDFGTIDSIEEEL